MNKVSLQKTFQTSTSRLNALFGLSKSIPMRNKIAIRKTAAEKTTASKKAKVASKKKTAAKKVTTAAKKAVKKTAPKKKKEMRVGVSYECSVCGLEVSVEKVCGCTDACDIICCGKPMEMI